MKRVVKTIFFTFTLSATCLLGISQSLESEFEDLLDSTFSKNKKAIGILIHVESPTDDISWNKAVGYSSQVKKETLLKNQPAIIASNTKTFVATAILKLVEQGKLELKESISGIISASTDSLLSAAGYDLKNISILNLLSHTSGIHDYVDSSYFESVHNNPKKRWTRDEQIKLSISKAAPLANPGEHFSYGDINYLILTEVLESKMGKQFHTAIRELIAFEQIGLKNTWFMQLEEVPAETRPMVHQYWGKRSWDSYDFDPSWDLYGGGGLASTVSDLGLFFHKLFNREIIKDENLLSVMCTYVLPVEESNYCLGVSKISFHGHTGFYHGGFWGTDVMYLPELDLTIAVYTLEKGKRALNAELSYGVLKIIESKR